MVLDFQNSANLISQNRTTGQLEEGKMQVYVRLRIRLLYKGFLTKMPRANQVSIPIHHLSSFLTSSRFHPPARGLLKALKQDMKFAIDDPDSAKEIPTFIEFHRINVDEFLNSLDSFSEFSPLLYLPPISVPHKIDTFYRFVLYSFNHPHICILKSAFPPSENSNLPPDPLTPPQTLIASSVVLTAVSSPSEPSPSHKPLDQGSRVHHSPSTGRRIQRRRGNVHRGRIGHFPLGPTGLPSIPFTGGG